MVKERRLEWNNFLKWVYRLLSEKIQNREEYILIAKNSGFNDKKYKFQDGALNDWYKIIDFFIENNNAKDAKEIIIGIIKEVKRLKGSSPELQQAILWDLKAPDTFIPIKDEDWKSRHSPETEEVLMQKESTLLPFWFLKKGIEVGKSVGKITAKGHATGFLVKDNYVLTNHHVLDSIQTAKTAIIEFNYHRDAEGFFSTKACYGFDPEPHLHFITCKEDDWTLVKVKDDPNTKWGSIEIQEIDIKEEERVSIIQHPAGVAKQIGLHNNFLTYVDDNELQYLTDTQSGSSGSPVFNNDWNIVGIHARGGQLRNEKYQKDYRRNGGTNINKVLKGIRELLPDF